MRLFFYYALHSAKNQIKKLFRSWVIVFLLVCFLLGGALGLGAGFLEELAADHTEPPTEDGEVIPDEELEEIEISKGDVMQIIEVAAAGITLAILFFNAFTADKSAAAIFQMPDVNLLFAAPLRPQSVLLFRLMTQILVIAFASCYFAFQIPTLVLEVGMDALAVIALFAAWILANAYGKLLNVLVFTLASTHERLKKHLRFYCYAFVALLGVAFYLSFRAADGDLLAAAYQTLCPSFARAIPVWGWLWGMVLFGIEGNLICAIASFGLLLLGIPPLLLWIRSIKADFYEDALARSQETASTLEAAQSGATARRKKDRSERIARDGTIGGSGASVFFFKTLYNRRRFSLFGLLSKTEGVYLAVSLAASLFLRFVAEYPEPIIPCLILSAMVFFRSLGNPLAKDMDKVYFSTVPATAHAKVFYSVLGGSLECALDLLPAMLLPFLLLGGNPLLLPLLLLAGLGVDFYAGNVMLFMELSLPTSLALQIKQMVAVLFVYFGLLPIALVVIVGAILGLLVPFLALATVIAFALGGVFFAFSPLFLVNGRK